EGQILLVRVTGPAGAGDYDAIFSDGQAVTVVEVPANLNGSWEITAVSIGDRPATGFNGVSRIACRP
ncbi:MAG TPA: hypothetical protein VH741_08475, partial [Candidatus Limnocylindrales bacterium]